MTEVKEALKEVQDYICQLENDICLKDTELFNLAQDLDDHKSKSMALQHQIKQLQVCNSVNVDLNRQINDMSDEIKQLRKCNDEKAKAIAFLQKTVDTFKRDHFREIALQFCRDVENLK